MEEILESSNIETQNFVQFEIWVGDDYVGDINLHPSATAMIAAFQSDPRIVPVKVV